MACTITAQKLWIVGLSVTFLLISLLLGILWRDFSLNRILYPELILKNNSMNYENWIETPDSIDLYLDIYMFNWTNADQVHNKSVKPHFEELGPYVFKEKHIRTNVSWHENGTISFNQIRRWHFMESLSTGKLSDNITNYNPIAATVAYSSRDFSDIFKTFIQILMRPRAPIYITKNVSELLFEGYDDELLDIARLQNDPRIPKIPFEKFGWFVDRNNSWEYDGNFSMFTGENDINQLGVLTQWKFSEDIGLFRGECDKVKGTTGEIWPPIKHGEKPSLSVFASDICRSVTVQYDSKYSKYGINGYKWIADDKVFDNGIKYPEMSCYCSSNVESCPDLLSGVFNASSCKFGAPAFVSFPHFYLAEKNYRTNIEGMNPNKEKHEFYVSMEPRTGIPLDIRAQLQINMLMKDYPWTTITNVTETMIPMFWFSQRASLSEELAKQARLAVMLPDIGVWIAYGLGSVGVLLLGLLSYCWFFRWRRIEVEDNDELLQ